MSLNYNFLKYTKDREGFEPPVQNTPDFKSGALNHSAIYPYNPDAFPFFNLHFAKYSLCFA